MEYMHYEFSLKKKHEQEVKLEGVSVSCSKQFKYLEFVL